MSLDLGTYNLNEGSHEVRVSILMLRTYTLKYFHYLTLFKCLL